MTILSKTAQVIMITAGPLIGWWYLRKLLTSAPYKDCVDTMFHSLTRTQVPVALRKMIQYNLKTTAQFIRDGHPHGTSARLRNAATCGMHDLTSMLGYNAFVISPSMRECRQRGYRRYFAGADFVQKPKYDDVTENDILIGTDVDYYMDVAFWLGYMRPMLLYSFVPENAGGDCEDGFYTITDNVVTYNVSGGGIYKHQLWDWNHDVMWARAPPRNFLEYLYSWLDWFGIIPAANVVMFYVDQYSVAKHRRILALVPFARIALVGNIESFGQELKRLNVSNGNFNRLDVMTDTGTVVSISEAGGLASATLPRSTFESARIMYNMASTHHLSDTERRLGSIGADQAAIVHAYFVANCPKTTAIVHKPGSMSLHYQTLSPSITEEGKTYGRRYGPAPLTEEAVCPTESLNNDAACITGRVDNCQKQARAKVYIQGYHADYAREFLEKLIPVPGEGIPWTIDEVARKQNLPRQQLRTKSRMMDVMEYFKVKSFQKREAYSTPNYPRNISTVPTTHTLKLSSYTYQFKQSILKKQPWFMPCRTPEQIALALQDYAVKNVELQCTDYSKFDGTITEWLRLHVEQAAYRRWVSREHLNELNDLLIKQLNPKARTKYGIKYQPGYSRLSGGPETTDGNTLIQAFVIFCARRHMGYNVDQAYDVGLCYGDDGVAGCDAKALTIMANELGLTLKCKTVKKHEPVDFLSRVFIDPWTTPSSFQDPLRALLKLHLTTDTLTDIDQCGYSKAQAYLVTDAQTPLISHWCRMYSRLVGRQQLVENEHLPWWFRDKESRNNPWPQEHGMEGLVAERLGVDTATLMDHCMMLDAYDGKLMEAPSLKVEPQIPKVDCLIMDGDRRVLYKDNVDKSTATSITPRESKGKRNGDSDTSFNRSSGEHGFDGHRSDGKDRSANPGIQTNDSSATQSQKASATIGTATRKTGDKGVNKPKLTAGSNKRARRKHKDKRRGTGEQQQPPTTTGRGDPDPTSGCLDPIQQQRVLDCPGKLSGESATMVHRRAKRRKSMAPKS